MASTMGSAAGGDFALSMGSISRLKYSARQDPQEGVKQAAKQFEALFLQHMLKQMRAGLPESDLLHSQQSDMYQSLMDKQWAQTLSERGIGLADMLTAQLQGKPKGGAAGSDAVDPLAAIAKAAPQPLHASNPIAPGRSSAQTPERIERRHFARPPLEAAGNDTHAPNPAVSSSATAEASDRVRHAVMPGYVNDFLDRMDGAAGIASRETGVPKRLILAQAALETGWGRHEISRADGTPSYNVFNIKATGWNGDAASVTTTEYEQGRSYRTQASFRAYESYDQAFSDYARLLSESPRYAPVVNAPSAEDAARALQNSGYATDPAYADKLVSIMRRLPADTIAQPPTASAPQGSLTAAGTETLRVAQAESAGLTQLF